MTKKYRVIQWGSGLVGKQTLRGVIDHPDLELAGLWVHAKRYEGLDAGLFCGDDPVGILATCDQEKLLAMDADCVCYLATDLRRTPEEIVDDICRVLVSGKSVVGTQASLGFPGVLSDDLQRKLAAACEQGAVSYFPTGINPNGSQTVLAALASMCHSIESTYLCEMYNFEDYEDPEVFTHFGYGLTPEQAKSHDLRPLFEYLFGPALHLTADWFGVTIDEVQWDQEAAYAELDLAFPRHRIDAGTVSAIRFNLKGMVGGKCRVTQAGCYWLGPYPSYWQRPPGDGGYRLAIKGEPDMNIEWATRTQEESFRGHLARPRTPEGLAIMGGLMATAARAVNAIPMLCESRPGIHTLADQSLLLPKVDWRRGGVGDGFGAVFGDARMRTS